MVESAGLFYFASLEVCHLVFGSILFEVVEIVGAVPAMLHGVCGFGESFSGSAVEQVEAFEQVRVGPRLRAEVAVQLVELPVPEHVF